MIRVAIDSHERLYALQVVVLVLTGFLALNGLLQFYSGVGLGEVDALAVTQRVPESESADAAIEIRIRGTGIFNDPNDLAYALAIAVPLGLQYALGSSTGNMLRFLSMTIVAANVLAVLLTRSRGGLLGLGVGVLTWLWCTGLRKTAVATLFIAMIAFGAAASGRMANLSASEESAQGRIEAWSAGLTMFKSQPVFGVGFGAYTDHHNLVAHNSFVHVLGELGFVGAFCLVGLALSTVITLQRADRSMAAAWWGATAAGFCCVMFLSRQYSVPLFVLCAVAGSVQEFASVDHRVRSVTVLASVGVAVLTVYCVVVSLGAW
jgi:hypothetical protein